jgi:dihydroorotate dehydrogenase electron transfer subunit
MTCEFSKPSEWMSPRGNSHLGQAHQMDFKGLRGFGSSVPGKIWFGRVGIVENRPLAEDTFLLVVNAPEVARRIIPGQFVMLRLPETFDPLLGRAFALFDVRKDPSGQITELVIVYQVVGKMTVRLKNVDPGAQLELWGPLGNGFPVFNAQHLVLVAGGIGVTPFMALAKEVLGISRFGDPAREVPRIGKITLCYGVRSKSYLVAVDDFRSLGVDVRVATEDGSEGYRGLVTDLLLKVLEEKGLAGTRTPGDGVGTELSADPPPGEGGASPSTPLGIVACGPEGMLEATARICRDLAVPCWVALESPMACGIGICFSCAVRIRLEDGTWDFRRACVEGPVFPADCIAWEV